MINPMINSVYHFECNKLNLAFGSKKIFTDLNYQFMGPGIIQIFGENGTGKSTLLKVFAGFVKTEYSSVNFLRDGVKILPDAFKAGEFSYFTTTSLGLLNDLTGLEHITLISKIMKLNSSMVELKILEFKELEIFTEILEKRVVDYSQGMKQLLRFFLHWFFSPNVIFLDEPFLYFSPILKDFCLKKIEILARSSIVFITDQHFTWAPEGRFVKIPLGVK